jgi:GT2 family glycosyltransferase
VSEASAGAPVPATVLICSRDRPSLLLDTIRSVLAGIDVPDELLIVDQSVAENGELAGLDEVRGCRVRYLYSSPTGLSAARNIGLRAARNDVVVMLDDDMLVEDAWFSSLLSGLPDGRHGVATGRVLAAPPEGPGGAVPPAALLTRETPAVYRGVQPLDVVPGANVAFRRQIVLDLGGYDERLGAGARFGAADDNDMGHRLLLAGCEVRHVPAAVVLHRAWRPRNERFRLRWQYGRGKGAFYAKHVGLGDRHIRRRAAADVRGRLRRAAAAVFTSPRTTAAELWSLAGMLSGALGWVVRERIPGRLHRTDH